jgi:acyl dehydratase
VVLGLGLSGNAWTRSGGALAQETTDPKHPEWDKWEFYLPGKYDAQDAKVLKEVQAQLALINNRGEIIIDDLVSGKLDGTPGIGGRGPGGTKVTLDSMMSLADMYGAHNPLWTDKNYAKRTKYGDLIAMPIIASAGGWPSVSGKGLGDYMVVSDLNVSLTFHRPVYEGDTLYSVIDRQDCLDITPAEGSYYRTFAISGSGRAFNQRGELIVEGARIVKETFRRHKDPAKRNPDGSHIWESPDWWSRKPHMYTDADYEYIKGIWENEKIRGAEVLYWDDVKVGDEPPPRAVGPIVSEVEADMLGLDVDVPQWCVDAKLNVSNPKTFAKMVKNKQGIYVLPEYLEKKPASRPATAGGGSAELSNRDGRAVVQNSVAAYWTAGMILNWMGDAGWLQRFGWDIMALPPGYDKDITYDEYPTIIPGFTKDMMPALFDKYPFMEKVPFMRGCRAAWHAMEGDLCICRAYVYDKFEKDGEYFVDLTWWCETLDRYLIEEGFATVKLPKK